MEYNLAVPIKKTTEHKIHKILSERYEKYISYGSEQKQNTIHQLFTTGITATITDLLRDYYFKSTKKAAPNNLEDLIDHILENRYTKDYRKTCTKCKQPKKAAEFSKDNSRLDGLQLVCKECNKTQRNNQTEEPVNNPTEDPYNEDPDN